MPSLQATLKGLGIVLLAVVAALTLSYLLLGATAFAAYWYFLSMLTSEGGINGWLARAVSLLLAVCIFVVHPTKAYLVSWIPRILSLRNSGSWNP